MKLRIVSEAEAEMRGAAAWYEKQCEGLGAEFLVAVDSAIQRIARSPEMAPPLETLPDQRAIRRVVLDRFPFMIVYEACTSEIRILAIAHTHRKPNYWKDRR